MFPFLSLLGSLLLPMGFDSRPEEANAVVYQGRVYFSLDELGRALGAKVALDRIGRGIHVKTDKEEWIFRDGGRRLLLPSGKEFFPRRALLVLDGKYYIPLEECADAFGYRPGKGPHLFVGDRKVPVRSRPCRADSHKHRVEDFRPIHEVVKTAAVIRGRRSLEDKDIVHIPAGTTLVLRRALTLDGIPYRLANDTGPALQSFLIAEKDLKTGPAKSEGLPWDRYASWFDIQAGREAGLRFGDRKTLDNSIALTIDMCWSLRPYETGLFQGLKKTAAGGKKVHAVLFLSGRWMEQHPEDMQALIALNRQPNLELIWGLHSWEHPKEGKFMNAFAPEALREDTLRLEKYCLDWGIVPSVFYRFPGLIHDRLRLREILKLDLFPIDCDSWLALVKKTSRDPFYRQAGPGSIILVHGNGNEPAGITAWQHWLQAHPNWELEHLNRFFPGARP